MKNNIIGQRLIPVTALVLVVVVLGTAWLSITTSRSDSLILLREQGASFTEALASSAEGALESEVFFDYLVHRRFNELAIMVMLQDIITDEDQLSRLAMDHGLYSITVINPDSSVAVDVNLGRDRVGLPDFVLDEASSMWQNTENNYIVLYDPGDSPGDAVHYYMQLTNDLGHVIIFSADANYFREALKETQIDQLVQKMSREAGVEYIVYQTNAGVVFSSRRVSDLSSIDADSFLVAALTADSITSRIVTYSDGKVLELVRPFTTPDYSFGLFRVGLSLDRFYKVSRGYDLLIVTLSGVLLLLMVVVLLYVGSRTKRRVISQELARMKSISDKVFEEMRSGVAVLDDRGRFVLTNRAFQVITGIKESVGLTPEETLHPERLKEYLLNRQNPNEMELTDNFGGQERTVLLSRSDVELIEGQANGQVILASDITRLKRFEREAARKQRLSELGDLAAGVAHEIRNPLNTISIAVQRLGGEFIPQSNKEEYSEFVEQIRNETRRLNDIITRFLALARDNSRREPETIDLTGFLQGMIGFISPEATSLNIRLDTRIQNNLRVKIETNQLKQVMSNLFNNAKEALAGKPGTVSIVAEVAESKLVIVIADSGPGIPEAEYENVLAPYYTTKDAGTGLGLPTVHRIISENGGQLKIGRSELGGAEISLSFPAA